MHDQLPTRFRSLFPALRLRRLFSSCVVTLGGCASLLLMTGVSRPVAPTTCTPTNYSVSGSAPAVANWTDPIWIPAAVPGSGTCDAANDSGVQTTLVVNTVIPNSLAGLNFNCSTCVIDIQTGGHLTLDGTAIVTGGAKVRVSGGTLTVNIPALSGGLTFQNGAQLELVSGTLDGSGVVNVQGSASALFDSGSTADINGVIINNAGTFTLAPSAPATLLLSGGAVLNNSGLLDLQTNVSAISSTGSEVINNSGTFLHSGSGFTTVQPQFNNLAGATGVSVTAGTLSLAGSGTGDAPFSISGDATLDFPTGSYTMTTGGVVSGGGTLSVTGATLSIGGVTEPAGFTLTAGTLTGPGFLSIGSTFQWDGGTIAGTGGAELAGGANGSLTGSSGTMVLDGRTFNDYGFIDDQATSPLQLTNGAVLAIYGTFGMADGTSITCGCAGVQPLLTVAPNGLLVKSNGNGTAIISAPSANNASVWVFSGTLEFQRGGTHTGGFNAFSGTTIAFNAAGSTFTSTSSIGGDGTIDFGPGSDNISGYYSVTGTTSIRTGAVVTMFNSGETQDFTMAGGTLNLSADFTFKGTGTWSGGTMAGTATFHSQGTLNVDCNNSSATIDGITFDNSGTFSYSAGAPSVAGGILPVLPLTPPNHLFIANNAVFENSGTFDIQGDRPISTPVIIGLSAPKPAASTKAPGRLPRAGHVEANGPPPGGGTFNNSGTFKKSGAGGTTVVDPEFNNSGTVLALDGTLDFTFSYTQTAGTTTLGPGSITVSSPMTLDGGVLNGSGLVTGSVYNDAQVAPGSPTTTGTIHLSGDYTQWSPGTLLIKLESPSSFDHLLVDGNTTLDGTFTATLLNGYAPANGTSWSVMTFATRSGDFATKNLPTYPNGTIGSTYTPTSFDLFAVVAPTADLSISKSGPAGVVAGQNIVYTMVVTNNGPSAASNVQVTDVTPAPLTFVSNSGACTGSYPCSLGTLNAGQSATITSTYSTPAAFSGNVTNTATVSSITTDPASANNSSSATTNVGAQADLSVSKSGPATVSPGQNVVYTIVVTNNGPSPATSTVVSDPTPGGLAFQSNSGACNVPFPCPLGTLNAGQSATITSTYTVPGNYSGATIVNSATVSSGVNDPNTADNTAAATTNVIQQTDLSITKSGPSAASPGSTIVYTIVVSNLGPSAAAAVTVNDATPAGLSFVSNSGACTSAFPCNLGTLSAGQSATITATFSIPVNYASSTITNTASVSSPAANDPNTGNDSSTVTTPVTAQSDVGIVKSGPASINAGQNIVYTIVVTNAGPLPAANVVVTDPTPPGLTFVSNSGACSGPFPCVVGSLASGQSATITSTFNVPSSYTASTIVNTAGVSSSTADLNSSNNSSTFSTTRGTPPGADLSITKSGTTHASAGQAASFDVTVVNNGPSAAVNVVVSDPTPNDLNFVSASGACASFPCTIPSLAPGQTATIIANYTVKASPSGSIKNTASVTSSVTDANPANNSSSAVVSTILCPTATPQLLSPTAGATTGSPVVLSWSAVTDATSYTVTITGSGAPITRDVTGTSTTIPLPNGSYNWSVQAQGAGNCPAVASPPRTFTVCIVLGAPLASVVGESTTGQTYAVQWTAVDAATSYEVEEATDATFTSSTVTTVGVLSKSFTKVATVPTAYFYRVRATSQCANVGNPYSPAISVVVVPIPAPTSDGANINIPAGSQQPITFQVFIPGLPTGTTSFVAAVDRPWLAVSPTAGLVPPEGMLLTVTADPQTLTNGTWGGTVIVAYGSGSVPTIGGKFETNATPPTTSVPVSVNLVTPVTPVPLASPTSGALIIPSVGHLPGANSSWRSDIRVANVSSGPLKYQISLNRGSGDPTALLKQTTISVDAGATVALDDIVRNWYGIGSLGDASNGMLIVQPLDASGHVLPAGSTSVGTSIVSSRTYNIPTSTSSSGAGTLGQFIPSIPIANFIGAGGAVPSILTLQQIAQAEPYRTNLGVAEATGKAATAQLRVFDGGGLKLFEQTLSLRGGEQRQLNSFLSQTGAALTNGRVEVQVTGGDGRVTAYASVIDGRTGDPLFVSGVPLGGSGASRFVVPGVADLNTGIASWRSDLRIFNGGAAPQSTTLTFYPTGDPGASLSRSVTVGAGEVKALDDVLQSLFGTANIGGTLHITTPTSAPLVVTARTYDVTTSGTLGQFIPAVTPADAVGSGDGSLQILQAEESARYRTNIGVAEVTGKAAIAEITVSLPDSRVSPRVQIPLAAFESRQIPVLSSLGLGAVYNARISVRVIDGDGKVTAYGSVIDMKTQDPTYVPAQ
jgi:uncharacterized repeat protein (TIGR01451 family)